MSNYIAPALAVISFIMLLTGFVLAIQSDIEQDRICNETTRMLEAEEYQLVVCEKYEELVIIATFKRDPTE